MCYDTGMDYQQLIEAAKKSTDDEQTINRLNGIKALSGWANNGEDVTILLSNWQNIGLPPSCFSYKNNVIVQLEMDLAKFCPDIYIGHSHLLSVCSICERAVDDCSHPYTLYNYQNYFYEKRYIVCKSCVDKKEVLIKEYSEK